MTQEREAMERLLNFAKDAYSNWDCDHACARGGACRCCEAEAVIRHVMGDLSESFLNGPYFGTSDEIVASLKSLGAPVDHLSRHARSLQPITVEGLVAMGFEDRRIDGVKAFYRPGIHAIVEDGELVFKDRDTFMPFLPQPLTLGDVDNLIERLSR